MIYIIRHGQTELNQRQVLQGRSDFLLNDAGIRQAQQAAAALSNVVFDHVFASPLKRAVQTAQIIAPDVEPVIDDRLIEMDYGPYEGADLKALPPEVLTFFSDFVHNPAPAGMKSLDRIDPELLTFSHENYAIYRHKDTGRWFAVFIVKDRQVFGLPGSGDTEIVSFKIKDPVLTDLLAQQPGYLRGYPSSKWNWLSAVLDGTIPFEDICRWINMSYEATKAKPGNKKPPLPKLEISG